MVQTFGFQPVVDVVARVESGYSRSGASVALSDMHADTPRLSRELDDLFRRGASEVEIAAFRARADALQDDGQD